MKKIFGVLLFLLLQGSAYALTIEITEGVEGALPIAIVPFGWQAAGQPPPESVAAIVSGDLARSGRFEPLAPEDMLAQPHDATEIEFRDWRVLGVDYLVVGEVKPHGPGGYMIRFQLFDVFRGEQLTGYNVPTTEKNLRTTAHQISDIIYEKLIGEAGAFATRIAYVAPQQAGGGEGKVELRVADADGFNPQTIVRSDEPLMSPAWAPDGRRIAYVQFENGRPGIYVQEVYTGRREKVASYKGINGAPAWSPDGRKLALTLSKDGNPDIFVLDLASRQLTPVTRHYSIDTEPAWSPDGKWLLFTSDRGGRPQIYRVPSAGGRAERLTFENNYNASASYAPDGRSVVMVTQVDGNYRVALLELHSRILQVLSRGRLDESPSFAPNGSMIIYAAKEGSRGVLEAVSVDGRVRQRLALDKGNVREPAWSPQRKQ